MVVYREKQPGELVVAMPHDGLDHSVLISVFVPYLGKGTTTDGFS